MTKKVILGVVAALLWASGVGATELSVSFSELSAELALREQEAIFEAGHSSFGIRGLYNDRLDSKLGSVDLEVMGPLANIGLEVGVGIKGYYGKSDAEEVLAAGIGAMIRYVPPPLPQFAFFARSYYCPKIFNTIDSERMLEHQAMASFQIVSGATIFVSYSEIRADIENRGKRNLDDNFRVGLTLEF